MLKSTVLRLLSNRGLQRSLNSGIATEFVALSYAGPAACSSAQTYQCYSLKSSDAASSNPQKLQSRESGPTPVSQAVAFMISKDQMPREQLRSNMNSLSEQLLRDVAAYSSTELSAFAEGCRWANSSTCMWFEDAQRYTFRGCWPTAAQDNYMHHLLASCFTACGQHAKCRYAPASHQQQCGQIAKQRPIEALVEDSSNICRLCLQE